MNPSDQARQIGVVDSWLGQFRVVNYAANPVAASVLADTGALAAGYYDVDVFISTNVALAWAELFFEWRNGANSASLWGQIIMCAGVDFKFWRLKNLKCAASERFRFYVNADITGSISTGIIAVRRA